MNKYAIIVAAGNGVRMGGHLPKQFLMIKGKPVLYYTLRNFLDAFDDMQVVLVLPESYTDMGTEVIDAYFDKSRVKLAIGGATRFESVKNGLDIIEDDDCFVFVHDGVRCNTTKELIHACYNKAVEAGNAIPVILAKDSLRILNENNSDALDRNKVVLVQTPQVFHSKIIKPAFERDFKESFTDEASVVESFGITINLVEGNETNIKITTPSDMILMEHYIK